jgi:hypothetical protein
MMRIAGMAMVLILLAGCGKSNAQAKKPELTERQRDSILATEPLPGTSVVGSALKASDQAASNSAGMNAAVDSLSR